MDKSIQPLVFTLIIAALMGGAAFGFEVWSNRTFAKGGVFVPKAYGLVWVRNIFLGCSCVAMIACLVVAVRTLG